MAKKLSAHDRYLEAKARWDEDMFPRARAASKGRHIDLLSPEGRAIIARLDLSSAERNKPIPPARPAEPVVAVVAKKEEPTAERAFLLKLKLKSAPKPKLAKKISATPAPKVKVAPEPKPQPKPAPAPKPKPEPKTKEPAFDPSVYVTAAEAGRRLGCSGKSVRYWANKLGTESPKTGQNKLVCIADLDKIASNLWRLKSDAKPYVTAKQAARKLNCHKSRINRWAGRAGVVLEKIGHTTLVHVADLERLAAQRQRQHWRAAAGSSDYHSL
jgi:hypothetical protein